MFKNENGVADLEQMLDFLEELQVDKRYPTIFTLVEKLSSNFPKGANFKEFVEHMQFELGETKTGPGLTRLFELLDNQGKKYLDKDRLVSLAREIGENITPEDIEDLIAGDFECENGKVDVDSFYHMMIRDVF